MKKLAVITRLCTTEILQYRSPGGNWVTDPLESQILPLERALEEIGKLGVPCGILCWSDGDEAPFAALNPPQVSFEDFRSLVGQMRRAQRDYFRTRSKERLDEVRRLEKQVDLICCGRAM